MYKHGDTGVPKNDEKFEIYRDRTNELIELFGGIEGTKKAWIYIKLVYSLI